MFKYLIFVLLWVGMICIKLPTVVVGWFIVVLLYPYRNTHYNYLPWWTRPWSNPEDWTGQPGCYESSLPLWWVKPPFSDSTKHYKGLGIGFWSFYKYYAWQNSANGLRSFESIDLDIDPSKVKYKTNFKMKRYEPDKVRGLALTTVWYWAWQGPQAGFKVIHIWPDKKKDLRIFGWTAIRKGPRHMVVKLGWRVEPEDASGGDKWFDIGMEDASFAGKVLLYRFG